MNVQCYAVTQNERQCYDGYIDLDLVNFAPLLKSYVPLTYDIWRFTALQTSLLVCNVKIP